MARTEWTIAVGMNLTNGKQQRNSAMKQLRPYQSAAVDSLFHHIARNGACASIIVAPVGAGKSLIAAEIIKRIWNDAPRTRIVLVTSTKELLVQNGEEIKEHIPTADMGFYCAGLGQKRLHNDLTMASIQSIYNKASQFNRAPQVIIVDECHMISHNEETTYRRFLAECKAANPNLVIVGMSGSPFRSDTGRLDDGEGRLFDGIAYEIEMSFMIADGFWARPVTPATATRLSVEGVRVQGGDYVAGQLEKAVDVDEKIKACVAEIVAHGANRRKWIIFTAGLQHCEHVRDAIRACGITAEMVTGDTPKEERDEIIKRYKAGEIRALVNVMVLTVGFNVPDIDMLVLMRPTKSPVLYIQTVGRGVRPVYADGFDLSTRDGRLSAIAASQKPDCLVLDFGNVIETLGAIDTVDIRKKPQAKAEESTCDGKPIVKLCPACGAVCMPAQKYCYECSYSFASASINAKADSHNGLMSSDQPPETYQVFGAQCSRHEKAGNPDAPPTMRVTYATTGGSFSEWVCFEHTGFARQKAERWHEERLPLFPIPSTVNEAVQLPYPIPDEVTVRKEGKFNRIIAHKFNEDAEPITPFEHKFAGAEELELADDVPF